MMMTENKIFLLLGFGERSLGRRRLRSQSITQNKFHSFFSQNSFFLFKADLLTLINVIVNFPTDVAVRMKLRNEFIALGVLEVTKRKRKREKREREKKRITFFFSLCLILFCLLYSNHCFLQLLSGLDLMDHPMLNQQLSLFREEMAEDLADSAKFCPPARAEETDPLAAALRKVQRKETERGKIWRFTFLSFRWKASLEATNSSW